MSYITVCTPTFNRAWLLNRPFKSLLKQTFKDFVWLIIDDGSTDNTKDVVNSFKKEADFEIVYVYKQNGGRASALNLSYDYIKTKYVINLDSDDEFVPDALQLVHDSWESIPIIDKDRMWCVVGHCIDSETGKRIGGFFPSKINSLSGKKQHKAISRYKNGEKSVSRRLDILKQYPFPSLENTTFVPENIVWDTINKKYDQFCTNHVFRVYHQNSVDSLSKSLKLGNARLWSGYYLSVFYINNYFNEIFVNKDILFSFYFLPKTAILLGMKYKEVSKTIFSRVAKCLLLFCWPFVKIQTLFIKK